MSTTPFFICRRSCVPKTGHDMRDLPCHRSMSQGDRAQGQKDGRVASLHQLQHYLARTWSGAPVLYHPLDLPVIKIGFAEPGRFRWPHIPPVAFDILVNNQAFRFNCKTLMATGNHWREISCKARSNVFIIELPSVRLKIKAISDGEYHLHLGLQREGEVSFYGRKYVIDGPLRYAVPTD